MDLSRWRLRTAPAKGPEQISRILQEPSAAVALIAVAPGTTPLQLRSDDPRGNLLLKILTALKQQTERFAIVEAASPYQAVCTVPVRPVFWLGDPLMPGCALCLPSLDAMLSDVAAKRLAWRKLKPWVARLQAVA